MMPLVSMFFTMMMVFLKLVFLMFVGMRVRVGMFVRMCMIPNRFAYMYMCVRHLGRRVMLREGWRF